MKMVKLKGTVPRDRLSSLVSLCFGFFFIVVVVVQLVLNMGWGRKGAAPSLT